MRCLIWILLFTFSRTLNASDFHSPRTAAMGGAGHAGPLLNDSIYLNPAFVAFLPAYSISANYLMHNSIDDGGSRGRNYNISIQDGRAELFQAGAALTVRDNAALIHLGASKSFAKRYGIGLGAKAVIRDGHSLIRDLSLGVAALPLSWFQSSLLIDNIVQSPEGIAFGLEREVVVGTKFNVMEILLLYIDPHYVWRQMDGNPYGIEAGAEFVFMKDFYIRGGAFRNSLVPFQGARGNGFGLGLGWIAPRISMDYSFSRVLSSEVVGVSPEIAHQVGLTVFF